MALSCLTVKLNVGPTHQSQPSFLLSNFLSGILSNILSSLHTGGSRQQFLELRRPCCGLGREASWSVGSESPEDDRSLTGGGGTKVVEEEFVVSSSGEVAGASSV